MILLIEKSAGVDFLNHIPFSNFKYFFCLYIWPRFESYQIFLYSFFSSRAATYVSTAVTVISAWTPPATAVSQQLPAAVCFIYFLFLI